MLQAFKGGRKNMRQQIIDIAKKFGADVVGFAPADRFNSDTPIFNILPQTKTVIGLGLRVLRGAFSGVEEGTTYFQYVMMGVETMEETVMPLALLNVSNLVEEYGFEAVPQRRNQLIMNEENDKNPEVDYTDIYRGVKVENMIDFNDCAEKCGLGEKSIRGTILNDEFGPFIRYVFILTDAELEPTPLSNVGLCDKCGKCIEECPGKAIAADGAIDNWRCAVYYNGANGTKNPFMPPDAYSGFDDRMDIIHGTAEMDVEKAKDILDNTYFYPPAKHFYRTSICGRACDRACYIHLEEKGILKKKFHEKFREKEDWKLSTKQYVTGKREKEWKFSNKP